MFQFLESPFIILLIIALFFLLLLVFFLTMSPKENGARANQMSGNTKTKVVKEGSSECTMLGYLEKLPKGDPIPKECLNCRKLVQCAMAKRAFNWYLGQDSVQNSENGKNNRTGIWKHIQR